MGGRGYYSESVGELSAAEQLENRKLRVGRKESVHEKSALDILDEEVVTGGSFYSDGEESLVHTQSTDSLMVELAKPAGAGESFIGRNSPAPSPPHRSRQADFGEASPALQASPSLQQQSGRRSGRRGSLFQVTMHGIKNLLTDHKAGSPSRALSQTSRRHSVAAFNDQKVYVREQQDAVAQLADFLENRRRLNALAQHLAATSDEEKMPDLGLVSQGTVSGPQTREDLSSGGSYVCAPSTTTFVEQQEGSIKSGSRRRTSPIPPWRLGDWPNCEGGGSGDRLINNDRGLNSRNDRGICRGVERQMGERQSGGRYNSRVPPSQWCPAPSTPVPRKTTSNLSATMIGCEANTIGGGGDVSSAIESSGGVASNTLGNGSTHSDGYSQTRTVLLEDRTTQTYLTYLEKVDRGTQTLAEDCIISRGCNTTAEEYRMTPISSKIHHRATADF